MPDQNPFTYSSSNEITEEQLSLYPFPIASSFQKILQSPKMVQRLQTLFETYNIILNYLGLSIICCNNDSHIEQYIQKLLEHNKIETAHWLDFFENIFLNQSTSSVFNAVAQWYLTVQQKHVIQRCVRTVENSQNEEVGLLSALYEVQQSLQPVLSLCSEEELNDFFDFSFTCLKQLILALDCLQSIPLVFVTESQDNNCTVQFLMGTNAEFISKTIEIDCPYKKAVCFYDQTNNVLYDASPFIIYKECYYCLRDNINPAWEVFVYNGHFSTQLIYHGTMHNVALHEPMAQYTAFIKKYPSKFSQLPLKTAEDLQSLVDQRISQIFNCLYNDNYSNIYQKRTTIEFLLQSFIENQKYSVFFLLGETGIGKTSVLRNMIKQLQEQKKPVFFMPIVAGKVENFLDELKAYVGGEEQWYTLLSLCREQKIRPIIILDSPEKTDTYIPLLSSLVYFIKQYANDFLFIISTTPLYFRLNQSLLKEIIPLCYPSVSKLPWLNIPTWYHELSLLKESESDKLYQKYISESSCSINVSNGISNITHTLLLNPSLIPIFVDAFKYHTLSGIVDIREILENYVVRYVCTFKEYKTFIDAFIKTLILSNSLYINLDPLVDNVSEIITTEIVSYNVFSPLKNLIHQHIFGHCDYLGKETVLYISSSILQQYLIYSISEQVTEDKILSLISQLEHNNLSCYGVVYFYFVRLIYKKQFKSIATLLQKSSYSEIFVRYFVFCLLSFRWQCKLYDTKDKLDELALNFSANVTNPIRLGLIDFALFLYRKHEYKACYLLLDNVLSQCTAEKYDNYDVISLRVLCFITCQRIGLEKEALNIYQKINDQFIILEHNSNKISLYCLLAKALYQKQHVDEAKKWYSQAISSLNASEKMGLPEQSSISQDQYIFIYSEIGRIAYLVHDYAESIKYLEKKCVLIKDQENKVQLAETYMALGLSFQKMKQYDKAIESFEQSIKYGKETDQEESYSMSQYFYGMILSQQHQVEKAISIFLETIPLFDHKPDIVARINMELGRLYQASKDVITSRAYWCKALEFFRKVASYRDETASCYEALGILDYSCNYTQESIVSFLKSYLLYKDLKKDEGIAKLALKLANSYKDINIMDKAEQYATEALDIFIQLNDQVNVAEIYNIQANIEANKKNFDEAFKLLTKSKHLYESLQNTLGLAECMYTQGVIYKIQGESEQAIQLWTQALQQFEEKQDLTHLSNIYQNLALIFQERNELSSSLEYWNKALQINIKLRNIERLSLCYYNVSQLYESHDIDKSIEYFEKYLTYLEKASNPPKLGVAYDNMGKLYFKTMNYVRARLYFEKALTIYQKLHQQDMISNLKMKIQAVQHKL